MRYIYLTLFISFQSIILFGQVNTADSLLLRLNKEKNDTTRIKLLINLGQQLQPTDIDSALTYYEKALNLSIDKNINKYVAYCYGCMADTYSFQSEYNKAISAYENSLKTYEKLNNNYGTCYALSNMGVAYWQKGNLEKCNECYLQALSIAENRQDTITCTKIKINIALVFGELGDQENALKYHLEALHELEKANDIDGILASLQNIGCAKQDQKKYDEAITYFDRALTLALKENNLYLIAMSYGNLASAYNDKEDLILAQKYNKKGIEYYSKVGNHKGIALSNIFMASISLKLKQFKKSEQYGLEALKTAKNLGALDIEKRTCETLINTYAQMKNFSKAYHYQNKVIQLKDSIYTIEKSKQIRELQAKFESEKKEKENELLKIENQLKTTEIEKQQSRSYILYISILFLLFLFVLIYKSLRTKKKAHATLEERNKLITNQQIKLSAAFDQLTKTNEKLENQKKKIQTQAKVLAEAVASKDKFFSIIAHDLRNPFSAILGFCDLLMDNYDTISNEDRKEYIATINNSATTTHMLLENLLTWANSQKNRIKIVKVKMELKTLVDEAIHPYIPNASSKKISVQNNISKDWFITADKYTLTTVFGNLFSNAIKFTNEGGSINLNAISNSKFYEIQINDTGVGMSNETIDSLFDIAKNNSTPGTKDEQGTGLGLILCKEFVEKNKGEIKVHSVINKGTTFTVRLPKE
nr:tetratricopeptide repeat-containing sensor histidine kinase [uncultured Marinifilum sp.]